MTGAPTQVPTSEELLVRIASEVAFATSGLLILDAVYTNSNAVAVMEKSAASFFAVTNIALQREVTMVIARLTDRPKVAGYPTICARRLVESLPDRHPEKAKLATDVDEIERRAKPLRDWRDKYIAHNDLNESFSLAPLATVSIEVDRDVLGRLGTLVEEAGNSLRLTTVPSPHIVRQVDGGKRLLHVLRLGLAHDDGAREPD